MSQLFSPSAAGDLLGVSKSTVRRYADAFARVLPDYGKTPGHRRQLSYDDLLYIWAIMQLHKTQPDGTSRDDILDLIQDPDFSGLVIPDQLPSLPATVPTESRSGQITEDQAETVSQLPAPIAVDLVPAFRDIVAGLRDIAHELQTARLEVTQEVDDLSRKADETDRRSQSAFNELHARLIAVETKQAQVGRETHLADRLSIQVWVVSIAVAVLLSSLITAAVLYFLFR